MCQIMPLSQKIWIGKLFTENDGKFKFSAQGQDLTPFDGNVNKVKIPSEKKPLSYLGGLKIDASTHLSHLIRNKVAWPSTASVFIRGLWLSGSPTIPGDLCFCAESCI